MRMIVAASQQLPALMEAYRTGGGVGWARYGPDMSEGQEGGNRPFYVHEMGDWIATGLPEVHARLGEAGAKVADVGCGGGWSSISIARAYPNAEVHGFDLDEPAVERARANAAAAGVADRVTFHAVDPREAGPDHRYDFVTAFECIHDMPHPVPVLATMRAIVDEGGAVMVMDEGVAESFTAPGDDLERLMYGFSTLVCLPDGMAHPDSVGTGHRDAPVDDGCVRARRRVHQDRDPADRSRVLALLPPARLSDASDQRGGPRRISARTCSSHPSSPSSARSHHVAPAAS